ncbi:MAG: hypothetical protein HYY06_11750 [Deltaproteobacteria bacterium]|nr:hypothetical protein [Deltaproteobacteria bacterium]
MLLTEGSYSALFAKLGVVRPPGVKGPRGTIDGRPISIGRNGQVVSVGLEPPLDLGLAIGPQGTLGDVAQALGGGNDIQVGDSSFDSFFSIAADEASRAKALLDAELRRSLVTLLERCDRFAVGDAGAQLWSRSPDEAWLEWALPAAARVAALLEAARSRIPVAASLAEPRRAWASLAIEEGLALEDNPLRLRGALGEARVAAGLTRIDPARHRFDLVVELEDALNLDLSIRPSGLLAPVVSLIPGLDREVGDRAFDAAFVIRSSAPGLLCQVLDERVRSLLLECRTGARDFAVTDRSISLGGPTGDPASVPRLARAAAEALGRIRTNLRRSGPSPSGPFR